jgi:hypothetical protein
VVRAPPRQGAAGATVVEVCAMRRAQPAKTARVLAVVTACCVFASVAQGCAGSGAVVRVNDGREVEGRFISPDAYRSFLMGAMAEEDGDLRAALAAYESVERVDAPSPEAWTRIARVRCKLGGDLRAAHVAVETALSLDAGYEPALSVRAECDGLAGGNTGELAARRARPSRLNSPQASAPLAATERERLLGLTLLHGDSFEAWDALAAWGAVHGDAVLILRGLEGVARVAPQERLSLGAWVVSLAGDGYTGAARELAGTLVDVDGGGSPWGGAKSPALLPLVARLAIDDAIVAKDVLKVQTRCARAHVGLEIAAARAWAMGNRSLAVDISTPVVRADPANRLARVVRDGTLGWLMAGIAPVGDASMADLSVLAADVALPLARDLLANGGASLARQVVSRAGGNAVVDGDGTLIPIAVDLALAGVLPESVLPPDGAIELALRKGVAPADVDVASPRVDARHRLLGMSVLRPNDAETRHEAGRLSAAAADDPIVAVALARLALARGEAVTPDVRARLDSSAVADPLAAAALLDVAQRRGGSADLAIARRRLAALAKTAAERARTE